MTLNFLKHSQDCYRGFHVLEYCSVYTMELLSYLHHTYFYNAHTCIHGKLYRDITYTCIHILSCMLNCIIEFKYCFYYYYYVSGQLYFSVGPHGRLYSTIAQVKVNTESFLQDAVMLEKFSGERRKMYCMIRHTHTHACTHTYTHTNTHFE